MDPMVEPGEHPLVEFRTFCERVRESEKGLHTPVVIIRITRYVDVPDRHLLFIRFNDKAYFTKKLEYGFAQQVIKIIWETFPGLLIFYVRCLTRSARDYIMENLEQFPVLSTLSLYRVEDMPLFSGGYTLVEQKVRQQGRLCLLTFQDNSLIGDQLSPSIRLIRIGFVARAVTLMTPYHVPRLCQHLSALGRLPKQLMRMVCEEYLEH
jgi:hypothetical protein